MARTQILIQSWGPGTRISVLFANGLNQQSLVSSAAQASEWSERVKFLMKKKNKQTNKQTTTKKPGASKLYKVLSNFIVN